MIDTLDNWIYPVFEGNKMRWNVTITEKMVEVASSRNLEQHCKEAIDTLYPLLGKKPAICFSGGIDSQTVIDSFLFAGRSPDVVILNYEDGFNSHDVNHAINFCDSRNITPRIVEMNVIRFLNNILHDFAISNKISSPQFATHLYFAGGLRDLGYTSAIFGGNNLSQFDDGEWYTPTKEETDWHKYANKINFPMVGSFWLHDWRLSLFATLNMPLFSKTSKKHNYQAKVNGYRKMGYDVIPQPEKYNGFETIKKYYEEMTGDGWAFENEFRVKLQNSIGTTEIEPIKIPDEIQQRINRLKTN